MSDLISRSYIVQQAQDFRGVFKTDLEKCVADMFIRMVDLAPAVDAVPVVRCKDCTWFKPYQKPVEDFDGRCVVHMCETDEEEYCSCGKRRGSDNDG